MGHKRNIPFYTEGDIVVVYGLKCDVNAYEFTVRRFNNPNFIHRIGVKIGRIVVLNHLFWPTTGRIAQRQIVAWHPLLKLNSIGSVNISFMFCYD